MNVFQHVQCRLNYFEIISELFQRLKKIEIISDVVTCEINFCSVLFHIEIKRWNCCQIISK